MNPVLLARQLFREGIIAVPAVRYAAGVLGIVACLALSRFLVTDPRLAILGTIVLLLLMIVLYVFSKLVRTSSRFILWPAVTLLWSTIIIFIASAILLFTSAFFDWPRVLVPADGGMSEEKKISEQTVKKTSDESATDLAAPTDVKKERPSQVLVLVMGTSNYQKLADLPAADVDVNEFVKLAAEGGADVRALLGPRCRTNTMQQFIAESLNQVTANHTVVLFVSMRGFTNNSDDISPEGYLVPYDAQVSETDEFPYKRDSCYKILWLLQALYECKAEHSFLFIDACSKYFRVFDSTERLKPNDYRKSIYVISGPRDNYGAVGQETAGYLSTALKEAFNKKKRWRCIELGSEVNLSILKAIPSTISASYYPWHGLWSGEDNNFSLQFSAEQGHIASRDIRSNFKHSIASPLYSSLLLTATFAMAAEVPAQINTTPLDPSVSKAYVPNSAGLKAFTIPKDIRNRISDLQYDSANSKLAQKAIEEANASLAVNPADVSAHYLLAKAFNITGEYESALEHAKAAIQLEPLFGSAYGLVGFYQGKLGRYEAAIEAYDESVRLVPDDPITWNDLGYTLRKYGENPNFGLSEETRMRVWRDAVAALDKAIQLKSNLTPREMPMAGAFYFNRGRCRHLLGQYEIAASDYKESIKYSNSTWRRDSLRAAESKETPPPFAD